MQKLCSSAVILFVLGCAPNTGGSQLLHATAAKDDVFAVALTNNSDYPIALKLSIGQESVENGCDGPDEVSADFAVPAHTTALHSTSMKCDLTGFNYYTATFSAQTSGPSVYTWFLPTLTSPLLPGQAVQFAVAGGVPFPETVSAVAPLSVGLQFPPPATIQILANSADLMQPVRAGQTPKQLQLITDRAAAIEVGLPTSLFSTPPAGSRTEGATTFIAKSAPDSLGGNIFPSYNGMTITCDNNQCTAK